MDATAANRVKAAAGDPTRLMARIGFASRGAIYSLIGGFAVSAAVSGQRPRGFGAAVEWLVRAPLGGVLVIGIAVGLACFAGWLAITGFTRSRRAAGERGWLLGLAKIGDALIYAGFVAAALGVALNGRAAGDSELQAWVAWLFGHTSGRCLVGLVGIGVTACGIGLIVWAWSRDIERPLAISEWGKQLTEPVSRYGVSGRGAAMAMVGVYLLIAAVNSDPSQAHGLGGVLQDLHRAPMGWAVMLLFGSAFAASAFFDFLEVFYRRRGAMQDAG